MISVLNSYFVPVYATGEDYDGIASEFEVPKDEGRAFSKIYHAALDKKLNVGDVCSFITTDQGDPIVCRENNPAELKKLAEKLGIRPGKPVVEPRCQYPRPTTEPDALALHLTARPVKESNGSGFWHELIGEDWIVYARKDWTKFLPADGAAPGTTWDVDRDVAIRLLTRFYPSSDTNNIEDHKFKRVSMKATLVSKDRVRLDVSLRMELPPPHWYNEVFFKGKGIPPGPWTDATAVGVVDFDPAKKTIKRFVMATEKATYNSGIFGVAVTSQR
jgi:hypothetical protein